MNTSTSPSTQLRHRNIDEQRTEYKLNHDIKSHYTIWLAHWVDRTNYSGAYAVWQYSEKGKVDGISGNVDLDICYKDFPTIIKGKGLNGFGAVKPSPVPDDKTDTTVTATIKIGDDTYKGTLVKA